MIATQRQVLCAGRRRSGAPCRQPIAAIEDGVPVVRDAGRVHRDPGSTTCPKCGRVTTFRLVASGE